MLRTRESCREVKMVARKRPWFVMVLHSHLPWVMGYGRWPFGEEWIYEIAWDCYIPLIRAFRNLERDGIPANVTLSVTPVLAEQLASESFKSGLVEYLGDRRRRVADDRAEFLARGNTDLARLTIWIEEQIDRALQDFEDMGRDIPGALADLAARGCIELATSAASHGYLPLLKHEKTKRLQIRMGKVGFKEVFGMEPRGFWFPECAYSPGLEELVAGEGYAYTVLDAMAVQGGKAMSQYGESTRTVPPTGRSVETVYKCCNSELAVFPRHPELCAQVWSRWTGYPGDFAYREFHKQKPRSGMRYYRVTDSAGDLRTKKPYDPTVAAARAREHAAHYVGRIEEAADESRSELPILTTAFDTELYGHWWHEGPIFLEEVARLLAQSDAVNHATPSRILEEIDWEKVDRIEPLESSWGVNCDHTVWMNERTRPMWEKIWELEDIVNGSWALTPFGPWPGDFWELQSSVDTFLREFLLMMASDWEFLMYTGTAGDYPERRFEGHRKNCAEAYGRLRAALKDHQLPEYLYEPLYDRRDADLESPEGC
jgi:1,4-alpha-glucan branching enzyme